MLGVWPKKSGGQSPLTFCPNRILILVMVLEIWIFKPRGRGINFWGRGQFFLL
jgi:hypothetical protein